MGFVARPVFSVLAASFWSVLVAGCSSEALEDAEPVPGPGTEPPGGGTPSLTAAPRSTTTVAPYPSGPYGRNRGSIIQNLSFLGWRDGAAVGFDTTRLEVVSLADFYDPDGTKGIRLLALNSAAVWCTVCRAEYRQLNKDSIYAKYRPKGVEILGVLFEDRDYNPARPSDLGVWGGPDGYAVPFPLVIDPGFKTGAYFSSDATPMNMLIDTRTMEIVDITMGYDTTRPLEYWAGIDAWLAR